MTGNTLNQILRSAFFSMLFIGTLVPNDVYANDLSEARSKYCDRIRHCTLASIVKDGSEQSAYVTAVMKGFLDNLCITLSKPFELDRKLRHLRPNAKACLEEMGTMKCENMMSVPPKEGPICSDYRVLRSKIYPDATVE